MGFKLGFWGFEFRVWGLGLRFWGLGFRVWGTYEQCLEECRLAEPGPHKRFWLIIPSGDYGYEARTLEAFRQRMGCHAWMYSMERIPWQQRGSSVPQTDSQVHSMDVFMEHLSKCERALLVTGAGISRSAGLPTFRSASGLFSLRVEVLGLRGSGFGAQGIAQGYGMTLATTFRYPALAFQSRDEDSYPLIYSAYGPYATSRIFKKGSPKSKGTTLRVQAKARGFRVSRLPEICPVTIHR